MKHQKNEIQYYADLFIENANPKNQWLTFTLYHGLQVESINHGEIPLEWERKGDLLTVKYPLTSPSGILSMQITGNGGVFNQISETSLFLSSTFPWYPIPGRHVVAEFSTLFPLQFKNLSLPKEVSFLVILEGRAETYSNLPQVEKNMFSGAAAGATLLSGTLLEAYIEGIKVVYPPDSLDLLMTLLSELRNRIDTIAVWLDVPAPQMPSQIFVVPHTSYEPDSVLFYSGGQLFISELKTRYIYQIDRTVDQLLDSKSLFKSFFWTNDYLDKKDVSPLIISMILEHFSIEKKENSSLSAYAKSSLHYGNLDMPEELAQLEAFSVRVLELYNQGYKKEIQTLVQKAYSELQQDVKTINGWLKLFDTEIISDLDLSIDDDLSVIT